MAVHLFEDLYTLGKSAKLRERIGSGDRTINLRNVTTGKSSRRGDGTFGERVPSAKTVAEPGYDVLRAPIASVEIGAETKILSKAMIKQIDRVINDLKNQVLQFQKCGRSPVTVAIVGVNCADRYVSFEGTRQFPTDGGKYKHPVQEAAQAMQRLRDHALPVFDEFLFLPFRATNEIPYKFSWVNESESRLLYSALLTRVSRLYEERFP